MDEVPLSVYRRPGFAGARPRLATVVDAQQYHRSILVVLGMHRSGTSLCSNVLSMLGVDMADEVSPTQGNERGHWERWEIVRFHDRVLEHFNRGYFGPFHDLQLPPGWWADPEIVAIRRELTAFLRGRMGNGSFGFKDPRTVRLLPLWQHIFAELRLNPRIVLCLRKPAAVARSLQMRDGLDPCAGEYRWLIHLTDFFRHIGDSEYCAIEYETWFDNVGTNVGKLQNFLNHNDEQTDPTLDQALQVIVDPALRHDTEAGPTANEPIVRQFYELVVAAGHDGAARCEIHNLIAQFDGWERLRYGFHRAYEAVFAIAEQIPDLEAEVAALEATVAEDAEILTQAQDEFAAHHTRVAKLEAEREAVAVRAEVAEQRVVLVQDEIAVHQARVAKLEAEREAVAVRAEAAEQRVVQAQAEIVVYQARVAALEAEREAVAVRAEVAEQRVVLVQDEIAAHQARVAKLEAEREALAVRAEAAEQRVVQAQAEIVVYQARVAALESECANILAETETREQDHAEALGHVKQRLMEAGTAEASLRNEVGVLAGQLSEACDRASHAEAAGGEARRALAWAEKCARQVAADAATLRDEAAALREQLEAARSLGARLVAAFCADIASAPPPVIFGRWWWPVPRGLLRRSWGRAGPA